MDRGFPPVDFSRRLSVVSTRCEQNAVFSPITLHVDGIPKAYRGLSQQLSLVYALELTSTMSLL